MYLGQTAFEVRLKIAEQFFNRFGVGFLVMHAGRQKNDAAT